LDKYKRNELTVDDIYNKYSKMNFYSYKIEGRTFTYETHFGCIIKYLVKPEYQLYIITVAID